ncbi:MAG TPA: exopolyphosphatase [Chitinophagales bacterium]|nr:exopolyphosphatase [Chitinophagales bacterium]HMV03701.1 exopolyphosphatase [Chitinophagales bacterium]HMW94069.1 exopolyphosphatase [Chitinophagales bacterium]HMY42053.1 exopolyphosphatase [Chitinophagales bacterium]HMZ67970.1 exopolyphosphatase [Chitinophagales bacterium]
MKYAAIDIGSNAVRLIFTNVYHTPEGKQYIKDAMYRVALRLGEESFTRGSFSKSKIEDMLSTMKAFKNLIDVHKPRKVMACATSAMRDASNSQEIVDLVHKKTGIQIEIISGQREAEFVLSNHVELYDFKEHTNYLYIDVGGGSTEIILLSGGKTIAKRSFDIGTLRMCMGKVKDKQWEKLENWLLEINSTYSNIQGIGVGGNINSIQKLFANSKKTIATKHTIETTIHKLEKLSIEERIIQYQLKPDRADVIVPAAKIFNFIMEKATIENLIVPKVGLGDGMIHYMAKSEKNK